MKRIFLLCFAFLAISFVSKGQIANGNLQTWASPPITELLVIPYGTPGSYQEPSSWGSMNVLSRDLSAFLPGYTASPISVFKDGSSFVGNGARIKTVKVADATVAPVIAGAFGSDTLGVMFTGKIDLIAASGGDFAKIIQLGQPFSARAQKIYFHTKYVPAGVDTASVWAILTKFNPATMLRDTIAQGLRQIYTNHTTFRQDSVVMNFNPKICASPDTLTIFCFSSGRIKPKIGSELWIDQFSFVTNTKSCDATLSAMGVSLGTLAPAFHKDTVDYNVLLPMGTTLTPTTTYTTTSPAAVVSYTPASDVTSTTVASRTTNVHVTAEDPVYQRDYDVVFYVANNNAHLASMNTSVGTFTTTFNRAVFSYTVTVPYATTATPTITATPEDPFATVAVTPAVDVTSTVAASRTTTVVVTASDLTTTLTYTVLFNRAPPNTNAYLASLTARIGTTNYPLSPTFTKLNYPYTCALPAGITTVPTVTAVPEDIYATTVKTNATSVVSTTASDRTTTVVVTAQDGVTKKTYTILFNTPASTGVEMLEKAVKAVVFPNPANNGELHVKLFTAEKASLTILDMMGKTVLQSELGADNTIDISSLSKGVYVYRISSDDTLIKSHKLIIE